MFCQFRWCRPFPYTHLPSEQIEYERLLLLVLSAVLIFAATFSRQPYPDAYDHAKYLLLYFFYFMGVNGHLTTVSVLRQRDSCFTRCQ